MYIIHWKNKITGFTGCGTKLFTKKLAEAWIKQASKDCIYWLVEVSMTMYR